MAISFNSVGHFFAVAFSAIKRNAPKVEAELETGIAKVEGSEATVEAVTAAVPGGAAAVPVEKAAYAVLGEVASLLAAGDAAAKAKLVDAGLDVNVVSKVEDVLKSVPTLVTVAQAL